jgi:transposase-like protein
MGRVRRKFSAEFRAKVALAALRGDRTLAQLTAEFGVHASQVTAWKKQALAMLPEIFSQRRDQEQERRQELLDALYAQIGRLKVELDWLKKKSGLEPGGPS